MPASNDDGDPKYLKAIRDLLWCELHGAAGARVLRPLRALKNVNALIVICVELKKAEERGLDGKITLVVMKGKVETCSPNLNYPNDLPKLE